MPVTDSFVFVFCCFLSLFVVFCFILFCFFRRQMLVVVRARVTLMEERT